MVPNLPDDTSSLQPAEPLKRLAETALHEPPTPNREDARIGQRALPQNLPDFEILGELGRGGMGVVFKARQISLNRIVALKMIPAGALAGAATLARFHVEAETLASLQHPNIIAVFHVGEHDSCPYLVTEFLDGGSLADYLGGRPQPPRASAELVETLARAVHCAHQHGIAHRDLKPANVLLQRGEGQGAGGEHRADLAAKSVSHPSPHAPLLSAAIPKIIDFGLAKRLEEGKGQTCSGAILGTPSYMAPEQASGRVSDIGPAADIYALGAILYEMLTGQPPFVGTSGMDTIRRVIFEEPAAPALVGARVPRDLQTICLKCLEKLRARRYRTAEALADDLRRFLEGRPISARPIGVAERTWKWVKRRPTLAALTAVVIAASAVLAGSLAWSYKRVVNERDKAHHSLQIAREAVDELYTKMATERLFDEPQLDPLCQELLEKAQVLYEDLAKEHSDDPEVRRDIALAWFRLGEIHRLRGHETESEQAYLEAIDRQEALVHDQRKEPRFRQDLATSHNWLGELQRENGRLDEAERHYRSALELQEELVKEFPSEAQYTQDSARSHYNLGIIEKDTGRGADARVDSDRAIELLKELRQSRPGDPNIRQDLARALINRGVLHRADHHLDDAAEDYGHAIDLLTRLREEFPTRAAYKFELAIARRDMGNLLWSQEKYTDAQRSAEEALTLLETLVADFSTRPSYKKKMGITLKDLGAVLASNHDYIAAERCLNRARDIFEELVKQSPETADYQAQLGMTLGNLGWMRTEQEDWPEARRTIELGIKHMRSALDAKPRDPNYRGELKSQCQDLAETLIHLNDHAGASKAATDLAAVFPDNPQDGYYAACFAARCVPLALADDKLGDGPARRAVADKYISTAVKLLRQAIRDASPGLKRLSNEKQVFEPLQGHPDFASSTPRPKRSRGRPRSEDKSTVSSFACASGLYRPEIRTHKPEAQAKEAAFRLFRSRQSCRP